jgi:hypothetical protein
MRRDLRSVGSFSGNNLFVVSVVFLFLKDPDVFVALLAFIGLVLFIPLSADPLRVLPRERLALWPLSTGERCQLRMLSPWLNPVTWLVVALVIWKHASLGLCAVAVSMFAIGFVLPSLSAARKRVWRHLPHFPSPLNHLIRKNLREMLSTLDAWCSVAISAVALGFRAAGHLPPAALLPMTILTMLAISTYGQTLFGLDGEGGITRYRLLPMPGWQILAAKDVPFFLLCVLLTLPLDPGAGVAAALLALAIGHRASVAHHTDQARWRFSSGVGFGDSLLQVIAMGAAAAAVHSMPGLLAPCTGVYAGSVWWYGRAIEKMAE